MEYDSDRVKVGYLYCSLTHIFSEKCTSCRSYLNSQIFHQTNVLTYIKSDSSYINHIFFVLFQTPLNSRLNLNWIIDIKLISG